MASDVTIVIDRNDLPRFGHRLHDAIDHRLRAQGTATKSDMRSNIQAMGLIDTGAMLESTDDRPIGDLEREVGPSAVSDEGFPYPIAQNDGTVHIPASPFASLSGERARVEFPRRFDGIEGELA